MVLSRRPRAAVALAAALALTLTACGGGGSGGGSTPGVTDADVLIGSTLPLTGNAAPGYSEQGPAAKAMFDYINVSGGIHGRKINLKYVDDVDFLNSSRVPDLFVASGCTCWDQPDKNPYTYGWQPDYTVEGKILGDYVAKNFAGTKVAYFYQDDDFGADGMKGLDKFIDQSLVVSRQPYQPGNTDVAAQVSAIARSGAEVVVLETIPAYTAWFKLTALKLGYNPQLVASSVGADLVTVAGLLENFAKQSGASVTCRRAATRRTRGSSCSRRCTTPTSRTCRSTATSSTRCRMRTRSRRCCRPRART
ncbi:ABC transporter substrate-binding protein [Amycolatopsis methanolica]|uniref:Amino acid-binding protein n=1 Tax=Amycolatopsis methanolica 239 TaxID=1068978 RepID=A0A076MN75_AMYME|nr:ABC transporter substrate-binding protein [Amycolatopsis methanolica]AIJ22084.1 amino acid-binding protein [Amycolatopsis methanolica 239]